MNTNIILPWHEPQWQLLQQRKLAGNLPHALLLTGPSGLGKTAFAHRLAWSFLCTDQAHAPCEHCHSCKLLQAGNHPDLVCCEPDGKNIKIGQIRGLVATLAQTAQMNGYQIAIIAPAEKMNVASANALLKTLEEPLGQVLIILVTALPARLPATIRSRCQEVNFTVPDELTANNWLQAQPNFFADPELLLRLAHGAPLQALALASKDNWALRQKIMQDFGDLFAQKLSLIKFSETYYKDQCETVLFWLQSILQDVMMLTNGIESNKLANQDQLNLLQKLASTLDLESLITVIDKLFEAKRVINNNLNKQLLLEDLLITLTTKQHAKSTA